MTNLKFDLIFPISYSTRRDRLLDGTKRNADLAAFFKQSLRQAEIVVSNCAYTFPGAAATEWRYKRDLFAEYGITAHRAEDMDNSVQEAQAIARYVANHKLPDGRVLVITGEAHSPSARFIWEQVMPKSEIKIVCIENKYEYQSDHPVFIQRTAWKWFFANVARQILLRTIGLRVGRWHHRSEG